MADTSGMLDLRAEYVDSTVKGFALQEYVMMQLVSVEGSTSYKESYFQETAADLTGHSTYTIKGVPRFAQFPNASVSWTRKSAYNEKYGVEDVISYEDELTNEISVIARTLLRMARAVVKAVDTQIWNVLTENQSASLINSVAITAGQEWNSAIVSNRDPIQNILNAIKECSVDNYKPTHLVLSPTDYANLLGNANVRNVGQFFTSEPTRNGRLGTICGLTVLVSNVVTADYALVVEANTCGTWKNVSPLTTETINDPGVKKTIRAWQYGVAMLTNPEACCLLSNTQA